MYKSFIAICVFFSWVKLFKYIAFNKTMTQLASTMDRCGGDIAGFGVMFFIVFFAYAQLGYLLFGTTFEDYSTFSNAVFTLLRTILGDFDFHSLEAANRILGPIFFMTYFFFVFFVLLNMFLAIINDTYSDIKEEVKTAQNAVVVTDYFMRGYNNMLSKVGMRNRLFDIEHALRLAAADGEITYEEIRQNLKK
jgi:polycystin 2